MFDIKFSMFFDRAGVLKHVADGTRSVLSKAGSFVWRRAKSSIKRRKRSATPGTAPSSHTGRLKNLIFFGYDASSLSVVIGPLLFRKREPTVPLLIEIGGKVTTTEERYVVGDDPEHLVKLPIGTSLTYDKFPFMEPALQAEQPKFPELFTNSIK